MQIRATCACVCVWMLAGVHVWFSLPCWAIKTLGVYVYMCVLWVCVCIDAPACVAVMLALCSEGLGEQGALPWSGQWPELSAGRVCVGEAAPAWTATHQASRTAPLPGQHR